MKNIHVLSTDKPSNLIQSNLGLIRVTDEFNQKDLDFIQAKFMNLYITSDEEIKEGDWCYDSDGKQILQFNNKIGVLLANQQKEKYGVKSFFKIILTDNKDLIKDGVQAIDIEFLEWFVNNQSCEEVFITNDFEQVNQDNPILRGSTNVVHKYKIIIPKEEPKKYKVMIVGDGLPKQETLEEVAERILANNIDGLRDALKDDDLFFFYKGVIKCYGEAMAEWQQEQMYSEEDMLKSFMAGIKCESNNGKNFEQFIKQFKKK
jgi:hypothetical protein